MKGLWIGQAKSEDARIVQQLLHAAYHIPLRLGIRFTAASIPLQRVQQDILKQKVYVLYRNRRPIGSVTIRHRLFGYEICHLAVLPESQGKGHGNRLLQFAERLVQAMREREVHLFTAENHPWLSVFYRKHGYKRIHLYKSKKGLWIGHYVKKFEKPLESLLLEAL